LTLRPVNPAEYRILEAPHRLEPKSDNANHTSLKNKGHETCWLIKAEDSLFLIYFMRLPENCGPEFPHFHSPWSTNPAQ
jgi:hypothetical protein